MSRLPIRVRLTVVFSAAMALAVAASFGVMYLRFESELTRSIDEALRSRADALVAVLVAQRDDTGGRGGASDALADQDGFAQLLDSRGRVLGATAQVRGARVLSAEQIRGARRGVVIGTRRRLRNVGKAARFAAQPVPGSGGQVVVVGRSLRDREAANESLGRAFFIGGPLSLLLAAGAGYGVAAGALRPVDRMRRRAATISAAEPDARLPVPPARDEIRELGVTLNEMLGRLEAALSQERSFTANASHELRTPLSILRSEIELALRRPRSPEELADALRSAGDEADRLARLADDLLVLARADAGSLPVREVDTDAGQLLATVARRHRPAAEHAGRAVVVGEGTEIGLRADPDRIEQALGNLIDNALRHGAGTVRLHAEERGSHVRLHVCDEGPGLPEGFGAQAFDRFTRANGRGTGSGLGLAIVEEIARGHGGAAGIMERAGGGTDAWIDLAARRL